MLFCTSYMLCHNGGYVLTRSETMAASDLYGQFSCTTYVFSVSKQCNCDWCSCNNIVVSVTKQRNCDWYSCNNTVGELAWHVQILWPWPWFGPHPCGCIAPHSDAIVLVWRGPLPLSRWVPVLGVFLDYASPVCPWSTWSSPGTAQYSACCWSIHITGPPLWSGPSMSQDHHYGQVQPYHRTTTMVRSIHITGPPLWSGPSISQDHHYAHLSSSAHCCGKRLITYLFSRSFPFCIRILVLYTMYSSGLSVLYLSHSK